MKALRIIVPLLLALACASPASAQSLSRTRDKKARLERDISILENQISVTRSKESNAAGQLDLLRAQSAARRELLMESEVELRLLTDSVRRCRRQVDSLSSRIDTMTNRYETLVRNAYRNRDARVWYMYILASENIGQGIRRYGYLRHLSSELNTQGKRLKRERDTLEVMQARLEQLRSDARKVRDGYATEVEKLHREEERSRNLVSQLQKDRKMYINKLNAKRKEVEALNKEIERLIAAEMDGGGKKGTGKQGGKKTSTKIDTALSKEFSANKGKLPWPAEGRVVSHFGRNQHPVYTKLEMPFNNGVGLAMQPDGPVKAVFNGVVKQIVVIPGYNQCILVQHGEYFTFYCKLGSVAVKAGDKVKTGEVLGHVATMGGETQLHFQLWKGKDPQDPEKWLRK